MNYEEIKQKALTVEWIAIDGVVITKEPVYSSIKTIMCMTFSNDVIAQYIVKLHNNSLNYIPKVNPEMFDSITAQED